MKTGTGDRLSFTELYRAFERVINEIHHPCAGASLKLVGSSLGGWLTLRQV